MFGSSSGSDSSTLGDVGQRLIGGKSNMTVHLDNYFTNRVYTSGSPLSGHVKLEVGRNLRFDQVQILFLGTSVTRMDGVRSPQTTSHTFLKLEMPIPESSYPVPRMYEAGRTYDIPFNFVIPSHLTINACNHSVDSPAVHDSHLCLPPTVGSWHGKDDFSPDMAKVEYSVIARVLGEEAENGRRPKVLESLHPVRVLPAHPELPPLDITSHDRLYKMTKHKTLRKSLLTSKLGKLTVSGKQPSAIMLSPDGNLASTTNAQVDLVFEPAASLALPPTITGVSSKITAMTYYSMGAVNGFPNMGEWVRAFGADVRAAYSSSTALAATHIDKLRWRRNIRTEARRGSTWSTDTAATDGTDATSDGERASQGRDNDRRRGSKDSTKEPSPIYHTASLQVPIELPMHKKMFIPSFHSCILSRSYLLWITVSLSCGGTNSSVVLGVPVQIGVQSSDATIDSTGPPSFEAAIEEAAADEFLRPRTLSIPDVQFQQHALPGYADLMGGRMVAAN